MAVFNFSTRTNFELLSRIPTPFHRFTDTARNKKNSLKPTIPAFSFYTNASFSLYFSRSNTRNFQVHAHFGRRTRRRNSIRKKLLEDQQVTLKPVTSEPNSSFQNSNPSLTQEKCLQETLNYDWVKANDSAESFVDDDDDDVAHNVRVEKTKSKILSESVLLTKLENWVDQYMKDIGDWGIGSASIFTVNQDTQGNVKRVSVDEDEIKRRTAVQRREPGELLDMNLKILRAKSIGREVEIGNNVMSSNSSVAKHVIQGEGFGIFRKIQNFSLQPELFPKLSRVRISVLCALVALWALKKLFTFGDQEICYTEMEKEMMRRKIKSRKAKDVLEKGGLEVIQKPPEPPMVYSAKPELKKEELMKNIRICSSDVSLVQDMSCNVSEVVKEIDNKIKEIREMAAQARKIEGRKNSLVSTDCRSNNSLIDESAGEIGYRIEKVKNLVDEDANLTNLLNCDVGHPIDINVIELTTKGKSEDAENIDNRLLDEVAPADINVQACNLSSKIVSNDWRSFDSEKTEHKERAFHQMGIAVGSQPSKTTTNDLCITKRTSKKAKPRIIHSVNEAREFLLEKYNNQQHNEESHITALKGNLGTRSLADNAIASNKNNIAEKASSKLECTIPGRALDSEPSSHAGEDSALYQNNHSEDSGVENGVGDIRKHQTSSRSQALGMDSETGVPEKIENWIEKNFHEVEPIIKNIGTGFRDNYMRARERVSEQVVKNTEVEMVDDGEFGWMKDDHLKEIVFRVRENELAGHEPFYLMSAEEKQAFFRGLEIKVVEENKKLLNLHEWLHSNIENLDYGADGISLYDPPEKILPRWKGPPVEKIPELLNNFLGQRETTSMVNDTGTYPVKKIHENGDASLKITDTEEKALDKNQKKMKTVIEGSDGSVKAGKKSGKEYWQHTKKWSRGFLESYNAETDPEAKSILKDIGKDLDRWITEKEIAEASEIMNKLPEKNKNFMEKKLNKLKREMELFGAQAVVSKYREYADEKEDYLWWLDLSYILCIELYTIENREQRIGFYSLEMAADLELEPKPYHVIAFEDAHDCKNLCYIIQAHMDMLGNGNAFVVARPPKDAFQDAKMNGFSVTVIRKGELSLNIDQTLEEVEEKITDIGSKMYHDMILKEHSVDISLLMNGVFGSPEKPMMSKKSKRKRKKQPSKR